MEALILAILPYVLTFLVGLIIKSPVYQSTKKIALSVVKALEDDNLSKEEVTAIWEAIKGKK